MTWTKECEASFQKLKRYLAKTLYLVSMQSGDILYLYLAVSNYAVSSILAKEDYDRVYKLLHQQKSFFDAKIIYSPPKKLALALVVTTRKL